MTPAEYASQQSVIALRILRYTQTLGKYFKGPSLTLRAWLNLLTSFSPLSGSIGMSRPRWAGRFTTPSGATTTQSFPVTTWIWRARISPSSSKTWSPLRARISIADSTEHAVTDLALQAVREVENAGRRQIIHAVQDEPADQILRGWARVATGKETCAWCLMLVSRGPVYQHGGERRSRSR